MNILEIVGAIILIASALIGMPFAVLFCGVLAVALWPGYPLMACGMAIAGLTAGCYYAETLTGMVMAEPEDQDDGWY